MKLPEKYPNARWFLPGVLASIILIPLLAYGMEQTQQAQDNRAPALDTFTWELSDGSRVRCAIVDWKYQQTMDCEWMEAQ